MATNVYDIMTAAMSTNWTRVDDFSFTLNNQTRDMSGLATTNVDELMARTVINVNLPQMGSAVNNILVGGEYRIYNAKFSPFTFDVTFRDFEVMTLRNYFMSIWMDAQRGYYDDVKSAVVISAEGADGVSKELFSSEDCLITSVSQVQMDNGNNQIAEFSVEMSSPYFSNEEITKFGSDDWNKSSLSKFKSLGKVGELTSGLSNAISSIEGVIGAFKIW